MGLTPLQQQRGGEEESLWDSLHCSSKEEEKREVCGTHSIAAAKRKRRGKFVGLTPLQQQRGEEESLWDSLHCSSKEEKRKVCGTHSIAAAKRRRRGKFVGLTPLQHEGGGSGTDVVSIAAASACRLHVHSLFRLTAAVPVNPW